MKRRKLASSLELIAIAIAAVWFLEAVLPNALALHTNCLANWPGCLCSWKSGKFVADCSAQNLSQVPKNDYFDFLKEQAGQITTLNRDIQLLNLTQNQIGRIGQQEFYEKKFRNLQRLYLATNLVELIDSSAFYKLTGLIELDLSENQLDSFEPEVRHNAQWPIQQESGAPEEAPTIKIESNNKSQELKGMRHFKKRAKTKGFLRDLSQLRQLNLNSNRFRRIDKFTFSPLVQLRQLYLSKNKIESIHALAFDGLQLLNVLHLDGNKLAYLSGELILKLPQLYSLQLAGATNRWQCDCRLRKLARLLLHQPHSSGALNDASQRTAAGLSILQDEPLCLRWPKSGPRALDASEQQDNGHPAGFFVRRQGANDDDDEVANSDAQEQARQQRPDDHAAGQSDGTETRRAWTNMTLGEFECEPRLAGGLLELAPSKATGDGQTVQSGNEHEREDRPLTGDDKNGTANAAYEIIRRRWLERQHFVAGEPIELTAALELEDELDLELTQIEWWRDDSVAAAGAKRGHHLRQLLWSSRETSEALAQMDKVADKSTSSRQRPVHQENNNDDGGKLLAQRNATSGRPVASGLLSTIDYVTRANASGSSSSSSSEGDGSQTMKLDAPRRRLVRVVHLILAPSEGQAEAGQKDAASRHNLVGETTPAEQLFACRITNAAGQLELVQPIRIGRAGSADDEPQLARRRSIRRQSIAELDLRRLVASNRRGVQPVRLALTAELASLANVQLDEQLDEHDQDAEPLFLPLHFAPGELLTGLTGSSNRSAAEVRQAARTPTSLRQINASAAGEPAGHVRSVASGQAAQVRITQLHEEAAAAMAASPDELAGDESTTSSRRKISSPSGLAELRTLALALIGRFTSNQRALIAPGLLESDSAPANYNGRSMNTTSWFSLVEASWRERAQRPPLERLNNALLAGLRSQLGSWRAVGEWTPLLLLIITMALAACLVASALLVKLHCSTQRRNATPAARPSDEPEAKRKRAARSKTRKVADSSALSCVRVEPAADEHGAAPKMTANGWQLEGRRQRARRVDEHERESSPADGSPAPSSGLYEHQTAGCLAPASFSTGNNHNNNGPCSTGSTSGCSGRLLLPAGAKFHQHEHQSAAAAGFFVPSAGRTMALHEIYAKINQPTSGSLPRLAAPSSSLAAYQTHYERKSAPPPAACSPSCDSGNTTATTMTTSGLECLEAARLSSATLDKQTRAARQHQQQRLSGSQTLSKQRRTVTWLMESQPAKQSADRKREQMSELSASRLVQHPAEAVGTQANWMNKAHCQEQQQATQRALYLNSWSSPDDDEEESGSAPHSCLQFAGAPPSHQLGELCTLLPLDQHGHLALVQPDDNVIYALEAGSNLNSLSRLSFGQPHQAGSLRQCSSSSFTSPNVTSTSSSITLASGRDNQKSSQRIASDRGHASENYANYALQQPKAGSDLEEALELLQNCLGPCNQPDYEPARGRNQ